LCEGEPVGFVGAELCFSFLDLVPEDFPFTEPAANDVEIVLLSKLSDRVGELMGVFVAILIEVGERKGVLMTGDRGLFSFSDFDRNMLRKLALWSLAGFGKRSGTRSAEPASSVGGRGRRTLVICVLMGGRK